MEIVTWVLQGSLVHQDSTGHAGVIYPGLAQRMSAGTGILHSEKNDSWRLHGGTEHTDPVHFVQMWVVPDEDRHHPRLRAAGDRRRAAARRPGPGRVRHGPTRRRGRDPDQEQVRGAVRGAAAARRGGRAARGPVPAPVRGPGHRDAGGRRARWPTATRCGSPPPAGSRSPPPSPPRSWSGRCTPPSPAGSGSAPGPAPARSAGGPGPEPLGERALSHTAPRCVEIRELPTPRPIVPNTMPSGPVEHRSNSAPLRRRRGLAYANGAPLRRPRAAP